MIVDTGTCIATDFLDTCWPLVAQGVEIDIAVLGSPMRGRTLRACGSDVVHACAMRAVGRRTARAENWWSEFMATLR